MNGILPLLKPKGMTSHDCVAKVRKLLKTKKVGHTGTLDPDVEGVLPICIGKATKLVQFLTDSTKTYVAEVTLGYSTTTEDASGEQVEEKRVVTDIDIETIKSVLESFKGEQKQVPPMYSAVKIKGRKLYEYAREGIILERPARNIYIYDIHLIDDHEKVTKQRPSFTFEVTCSKGTYVRTLAVDIGKKLGYPAHMSQLVRTKASFINMDDCLTFAEIEQKLTENDLRLISIEEAVSSMSQYTVDDDQKVKILNGAVFTTPPGYEQVEKLAVLDQGGTCLAIYEPHPRKKGLVKPVTVFHSSGND